MQVMQRTFGASPVAKQAVNRSVVRPSIRVQAQRAGNFAPGSEPKEYLNDLPGNFNFDPLELGKEKGTLQRYREAELIHCRWAMLGAAGCLAVEVLGLGNWYDAPLWAVTGDKPTWFGIEVPFDIATILGVEVVAMAVAEGLRNDNQDMEKRLYPGGAFDPLGFSKDPKSFEDKKLKELKNGRLAMVACLGFAGQHAATGKPILEALGDHLSSPFFNNFATNGVSVPGV
uniref:Chlorophyll a-b binding protein, chloroplastic n=3 Tax=Dunaliella TaxID=3044 RepID=A0A7S3VHS4_DUNTE|nr:photosystem I light-harvesting cholrophyll-a/b protein 2 [Dunaliella salina]|mmetsp:Transcript_22626/g.62488  ORF Transcript_22626/g.62488 Transcript_22626/m.62488 type:complete len:229 (-) Transcript_22626:514-1200(-)|eukprot:CAMPEP_0202345118 /NCGR_PEP_ID=MMETSP1126-20121109/4494_1 /ASSEMBLY_ACC=CAM_ASM_000457 /TAXON_ID=3047 /ORGANISM="Dunaliella tertiolecta, Strain CCMP1320" /LENGTH=228 /DNA_ID=CAMNT_0048936377 /DNA_START=57 /DNA_END=743 /DNA_ORIENTATION=+